MTQTLIPRLGVLAFAGLAMFGLTTTATADEHASQVPDYVIAEYGTPPEIPIGPLSQELQDAVRTVFVDSLERSEWTSVQSEALEKLAASGNACMDYQRHDAFYGANRLTCARGCRHNPIGHRVGYASAVGRDHRSFNCMGYPLLSGYLDTKRAIFTQFVPGWEDLE